MRLVELRSKGRTVNIICSQQRAAEGRVNSSGLLPPLTTAQTPLKVNLIELKTEQRLREQLEKQDAGKISSKERMFTQARINSKEGTLKQWPLVGRPKLQFRQEKGQPLSPTALIPLIPSAVNQGENAKSDL